MLTQITGLHHVTSLATSARQTDRFMSRTLGLRRVKQTVNFDAPDVYHLYYGDAGGTPGTVMTYFPFPDSARGRRGTGEAGVTAFSVPEGSLGFWADRLSDAGATVMQATDAFGAARLTFDGPDCDGLALIEARDGRAPWTGAVDGGHALRGFHSVTLQLSDIAETAALLRVMGFAEVATAGAVTRFAVADGVGDEVGGRGGGGGGMPGRIVDLEAAPETAPAVQGAGSVHHVAFAVADRAHQAEVRAALIDAGHRVTPSIDRDYFHAIYFRSPGGVLFEVATTEPGFDRDEAPGALGTALKLPAQHEPLRQQLLASLEPLDD